MDLIKKQLTGKDHKEYIISLALEYWNSNNWEDVLEFWIDFALKKHRERMWEIFCAKQKKEKVVKYCEDCKNELSKSDAFHLTKLCTECWRKRYIKK